MMTECNGGSGCRFESKLKPLTDESFEISHYGGFASR
jgi:hypothetical protein